MKIFIQLAFVFGFSIYGIAQEVETQKTPVSETRMFPQNVQNPMEDSASQDSALESATHHALPNAISEEDLQNDLQKALDRDLQNDFEEDSTTPNPAPLSQDSTPNLNLESLYQESQPQESQDSTFQTPNPQDTLQETDENPYPINSLAKNVYLEILNPPLDILYVHQVISLDLKLLVLTNYSTIKTEFVFENSIQEASVEILNPNESWNLNTEDSSLRNTFYFKIKQPNYTIPQIKISVNTDEGEATESTQNISGKAIKLERQGSFCQVLAQDLKILDTKITNYDTQHNLAVFQFQSTMGNLFDFHLASYTQQGIESKSGDYKQAEAFYYAIVPKDLNTIRFDYFNTKTSKYTELLVDNIAIEDRVSTQSDIKPKNNHQFFKIASMASLAILFFGLYLYKRKLIFVLLGIIALGVLFYFLTLKTSATLKANASLRIQPTFNSTIILTTQEPIKVEILGQRSNYYKVLLQDDRIGWVKRDDLQN
ncbi:SH3 domain-containing protein [Helicobacter sp. MIT 05-5294]|uniref:SH3 domain-containing protein n=1 Tax=Helicobacter sp. MIT 05-5294 TaxID=1548150 RepID=UPI000ADEC6CA|nr:SH3 domain-containing protein [Helicobacter sp. MIT 05-5294]